MTQDFYHSYQHLSGFFNDPCPNIFLLEEYYSIIDSRKEVFVMAFDGIMLYCVAAELRDLIIGGRIDKIHQPEKDEIHIEIRSGQQSYKLLVSASPNYPRLHLAKIRKNNPASPPLFCMVLRKHLIGGRILSLDQPDFERILILNIESRDELGGLSIKQLIVEIMGRHSNIILKDENGLVIDSIKRVPKEISRVRQLLPGMPYIYPPSQNKRNPLLEDKASLAPLLETTSSPQNAVKTIMGGFTGISKVSAQEIVYRSKIETNLPSESDPWQERRYNLAPSFIDFFDKVKEDNFQPAILKDNTDRPKDIFPFPYYQFGLNSQMVFESVSEALETFYSLRDSTDRKRQRTMYIGKTLNNYLDRATRKHGILLDEYKKAEDYEAYKLKGELITANIFRIHSGNEKVILPNYYDPSGAPIEIMLDKRKTPSQNAQAYYKRYNKAKNALIMIDRQLKETEAEISYLESQIYNLEKCNDEKELQEIRQELSREGYLKISHRERKKTSPTTPHRFVSSDGFHILVGKNNVQNDRLTFKIARPNDLWLHTKDIPGSHVIIKTNGSEISKETIMEACLLAAFFSKGRGSSKVPVDYCLRKNVRKPKGAKLGMVIYDNYNTIFVTPDEESMNKLRIINQSLKDSL